MGTSTKVNIAGIPDSAQQNCRRVPSDEEFHKRVHQLWELLVELVPAALHARFFERPGYHWSPNGKQELADRVLAAADNLIHNDRRVKQSLLLWRTLRHRPFKPEWEG